MRFGARPIEFGAQHIKRRIVFVIVEHKEQLIGQRQQLTLSPATWFSLASACCDGDYGLYTSVVGDEVWNEVIVGRNGLASVVEIS